MKALKYVAGAVALLVFFLAIDPSGVGFGEHLRKIKQWANGERKHLRFETARR